MRHGRRLVLPVRGAPRYRLACRVTFGCRVSLLGSGKARFRHPLVLGLAVSTASPFAVRALSLRCRVPLLARLRARPRAAGAHAVDFPGVLTVQAEGAARKPGVFVTRSFERTEARRRSCGGRMRSERVSCRSVQGEGQSPARRVALDGCRVILPRPCRLSGECHCCRH